MTKRQAEGCVSEADLKRLAKELEQCYLTHNSAAVALENKVKEIEKLIDKKDCHRNILDAYHSARDIISSLLYEEVQK